MPDLSNILLVVNPISGDIDKRDLIRQVEEFAKHRRLHLEVYKTTGEDDESHLTQLINSFAPHRVLIAGGDGSIKLMAEVMRHKVIPMGILPTGSSNGLARNLSLPKEIDAALEVAMGHQLQDVDAICVNDQMCLHISDLGLNAELIEHYEKGNIRGKLGYVIQSIPTLIESDMPFTFEVTIDGQTIHYQGVQLAIANARQYGTGAVINPHGLMDDGKFEILIFKKFDLIRFLRTLREELEMDPEFVESFSVTQATIHCQRPVPFQIDGEYYEEVQDLTVSIQPKLLKIAVGR